MMGSTYLTLFCVLLLSFKCHSVCLVPSKDILDACRVGQLSIVTQPNMLIRNQDLCNREISQDILSQKLNIKIENFYSFDFTKNTTFTLVMIDVTTNKLLWMLSNITSMSGEITTTQNNIFNHHAVTVREYSPPNLLRESAQASHLIQIFIFQEDSPATAFPLPPADPFYIRDWVMRSQSSNAKHLMCGPVAGLQFKVNKSTLNKDYKGLSNYVYSVAPSRGTSSWNRKFRVEFFLILFLFSCGYQPQWCSG